jgi:hypothetical protein
MDVTQSLPKIDLTTFVLSISSAAFMAMGLIPREDGKRAQVDLELARQNIDLLELMDVKTKGNRTDEENRILERVLFEARMRFVEVERGIKV